TSVTHDRADDFVPAAAVFDVAEAQAIGHGDTAAVRVESALRIDLQVAAPIESGALVADDESYRLILPLERHLGVLAGILRESQTPLHFVAPSAAGIQLRLVLVGDAEVAVFDGVDEELCQADHGGRRIGTGIREHRAEVAGLLDGLKCEQSVLHQSQAVEL